MEGLKGPFAQLWLEAWRAGFSSKLSANASYDEIRELALSYNDEQMDSLKQHVTSNSMKYLKQSMKMLTEMSGVLSYSQRLITQ